MNTFSNLFESIVHPPISPDSALISPVKLKSSPSQVKLFVSDFKLNLGIVKS